MLEILVTLILIQGILIFLHMLQKQQTTIVLRPILPLFLKGQRLTIDLPHIMITHTTTIREVDTTHIMTPRMAECITGTTLHGTVGIKLALQMPLPTIM
jgi:hypothetical protein